ncbi:MAG: hypothetical protein JWP69_43 [Flaviaesturariibacter sp.]|nr:hypothetical protein [Flaviaesturariibacter sp.]
MATFLRNDKLVVAWFTESIPLPFGPHEGGLPGLILEVNYAGTGNIVTATKMEKTARQIVRPDKGKLVSWKEFYAYLEKNKRPTFTLTVR